MSVPRKTTKIYRVVLSAATFFVLCLCTRHQFNLFQCLPKEMIADNAPQVKYQVDKLLEEIRRIKNETSSEIETQKNRGNKLEEQLKKIVEESSAKISIGENRTNNLEQHTRKYQIDPRYFSDPRRFRGEMTKKLSALLEKNIKSYSQLRDEGNLSSYVQDDHPLFNGVKLGDFSIEALLRMYPKVDVSTCLKYNADKTGRLVDTTGWYEIERSINNVQHNKKLINFSLFRKRGDHPFGELPEDRRLKWETKYAMPVLRMFDTSHPEGYSKYFTDCDFHLYLARDLKYMIDANMIPKHENLTIHLMKTSSVGTGPGSLWRFLGLNNPNYDITASSEADTFLRRSYFEKAEEVIISADNDFNLVTTGIGYTRGNDAFLNSALIMGGIIVTKPSALPFDMASVIMGFTKLVHDRLMISTPLTFTNNEPVTWWNRPVRGNTHVNGWGSNIFGYGFDERFLKHVVYYATKVKHQSGPACYQKKE